MSLHIGVFRLQRRRRRRHLYRLGHRSGLELDVEAARLLGGHLDVFGVAGGEARHFCVNFIGAWRQLADAIEAVAAGLHRLAHTGSLIGDGDGSPGNNGSGGIGDRSLNGGIELGRSGKAEQQDREEGCDCKLAGAAHHGDTSCGLKRHQNANR